MVSGMKEELQVRALVERYPYMFRLSNTLDLYAGWLPPFVVLCDEIDALLAGRHFDFHFLQIKEKFGGFRAYFYLGLPTYEPSTAVAAQELAHCHAAIQQCVESAHTACASRCMVCGASASLRRDGPLMRCLCDEHAKWSERDSPWSSAKVRMDLPSPR